MYFVEFTLPEPHQNAVFTFVFHGIIERNYRRTQIAYQWHQEKEQINKKKKKKRNNNKKQTNKKEKKKKKKKEKKKKHNP